MKKSRFSSLAFLLLLFLMIFGNAVVGFATDTADDPVQAVIDQLEAIDTLQEMQDKRSSYSVSTRTDLGTGTSSAHEEARAGYESYVAGMFAAREAAQQAYNALSSEQKEQIDSALVAKLNDELSTVFNSGTYSVTPGSNAYVFDTVKGGTGYAYEVSNHMVSGNIPQTFILVDTSDGKTSWTPSGLYEQGSSNYEVAYCCDVETGLEYSTDYKRLNLEDSSYYGENAAAHIRAILENAYPFVSMSEMRSFLKSSGLSSSFVDTLTRSDIIAGVQAAIWAYANSNDTDEALQYFASVDITKNSGIYFTPLHDTNNETWDWLPGARGRTFDARAQKRVNTLAYFLINLDGVKPSKNEIVISDVKVTRAELLPGSGDTYEVGMYVHLNHGGSEDDDLKIVVSSSSGRKTSQNVNGRTKIPMTVAAAPGDTITVVVEGTQHLAKGVYFYEPEGGRDASQCLVGVGEGETPVYAEETFTFDEEIIESGLRIYKSESGTGLPLSDITFDVYKVPEGGTVSSLPTNEEIAAYATSENMVASITTDETGYADVSLDEGYYLIIEEHNTEKIVAPVHPFYISVPMSTIVESDDGTTSAMVNNIVSVYPKNETVTPPEEPPITPPIPDTVKGNLQVIKHSAVDSSLLLPGAEFNLYRPATEDDTDTEIISCNGVQYAVVLVGTLKTENGVAAKNNLSCGLYFLVETKAPAGYNLLNDAVSVTVVSSEISEVTTIRIANEPGYELPETGGEGTTWFYLAGGVLTLLTAALLISKKRMSAI